MKRDLHRQSTEKWSEMHFGGVELGDRRRERRARKIANAFAEKPGASIPQLFKQQYDVKAAYTFFDKEKVMPEKLQASHQKIVKEKLQESGTYLLIEDGSEFNWPDKVVRDGLGKTRKTQQGFILHSSLVVGWHQPKDEQRQACEIIGLVHQEYYPRVPRPEGEGKDSTKRKKRKRESQLWERSGESIGNEPEQEEVRWVRVADRGADIAFFLEDCQTRNHGFVVRAAQNRLLLNESGDKEDLKLFEKARELKPLGSFELFFRKRGKQASRSTRLSISSTKISIRNPDTKEAIHCSVVRIWEANPPKDTKALEWILLTDVEPQNFEEALEIALQYEARWLIEEYHKCLKTGLSADDLQLQTAHRLFAAIAIMAIVAVRLLALKEAARIDPKADLSHSGLTDTELQVLALSLERNFKTVADVVLAIGRLGGHMNRKSDGLPGWQTLWKGMKELESLVQGFKLAQSLSLKSFGV